MAIVVASLNVTFGEDTADTTGVLKLEIDDRENGLNGGDTSFSPGDSVGYIMYMDDNVDLLEHFSTAGGITTAGTITKEVDEKINFSNSDTGSLNYPPSGGVALSWLGRSYEIYTDANGDTHARIQTALPERTRSSLRMPGSIKVAGILRAVYDTTGDGYRLQNVPEDFDEAVIFAIGEY